MVIADTNLGLIANAPVFVLAAALAVGVVLVRGPRRLFGIDILFALAAGALFLASFSQTSNYNHGGTPRMSRYAVWLIPLVAPFLRRVEDFKAPWTRGAAAVLVGLTCAWSLASFHPALPETATPSPLARWLWTHYPAVDNPIPEVFVERIRATDGRWRLPTSTPDCRKILLMGRGDTNPAWPLPCFPADLPPECRRPGALCYANRQGMGYEFSLVPKPSHWVYRLDEQLLWTNEQSRTAHKLLTSLKWWEMAVCRVSVRRVREGELGLGGPPYHCASDRLLAFFGNSGGAEIPLRLGGKMSGAFFDGSTGDVVSTVSFAGEPGELWHLPIPVGPASIFLVLTSTGRV